LINIDPVKPTVKITGVTKGHTYPKGTKLHVKCTAKDTLSGLVGVCVLKATHKREGNNVAYTLTATANDKAGNQTVKTISWKVAGKAGSSVPKTSAAAS
jgi:hypothetical protein